LEYINQAAYWDYQREKIYVRSSPQLKRVSRRRARGRAKTLPVNRIIECSPPSSCPKCKSPNIPDFSVMLFRSDSMLVSEENHMKTHITERPPAESWRVQKVSADSTAD
jgi:hypothetical protein